jgi:hypothetical protein
MKKLLHLAVAALLCACGFSGLAFAQTTTVTASHLKMAGANITVGVVTFTPVSVQGVAIAFADGTGAQNSPTAFACNIASGAITTMVQPDGTSSGACNVPDAGLTAPANILYLIQVCNTSTGLSTSGKCYTLQAVVGVSGSTWPLDHYGPPAPTTNVQAMQTTQGTSVPVSCASPSLFIKTTDNTLWVCIASAFVQVSGTSSGIASLVGDVTSTGMGAAATTVVKVNNGVVPANATLVGTNSLGQLISVASPPAIDVRFVAAAICNGGVAYSAGLSTYDNQQPQFGCIAPATSAAAYMAFQAAASPSQYATVTVATPPYWTGTDLVFTFKGTATTGNVGWIVETGCTNANGDVSAPTFGTPVTVTTTVSGTLGGTVNGAQTANVAVPATNGCTASTTGPSSLVTLRIHRSASDSQTGDAHLLGITLTTHRSQ